MNTYDNEENGPKSAYVNWPYSIEDQLEYLEEDIIYLLNQKNGVRIAFLDGFEPPHIPILINIITKLSKVKAKCHILTQESDFISIFGKTGIMIDIPIVCVGPGSEHPQLGMRWEEAFNLRENFTYVGVVLYPPNEESILWGMRSEKIDRITPNTNYQLD